MTAHLLSRQSLLVFCGAIAVASCGTDHTDRDLIDTEGVAGSASSGDGDKSASGGSATGGVSAKGTGGSEVETGGSASGGAATGGAGGAATGGAGGAATGGTGGEGPVVLPPCDEADADGDGYFTGTNCSSLDCNDADARINPGATERADDGIDDDCSGTDLRAADGDGTYVSETDAACSDTGAGAGSKATPFCSLSSALASVGDDAPHLFVAHGEYPHALLIDGHLAIHGGYEPSSWLPSDSGETHIGALAPAAVDTADGTITEGWLDIIGEANVLLQGLNIFGGQMTGDVSGVHIRSSGLVAIIDTKVTGPRGKRAAGVLIRAEAIGGVLISESQINGGRSTEKTDVAGVSNAGRLAIEDSAVQAGTAERSDNPVTISCGLRSSGQVVLVRTVVNGAATGVGEAANHAYGVCSEGAGTLIAVNNLIYGGRGFNLSAGVRGFSGTLRLINNNISGGSPVDLTVGYAPFGGLYGIYVIDAQAATVSLTLLNNNFYTAPFSNEGLAYGYSERHLDKAKSTLDAFNLCMWTGCVEASGNLSVEPGFVDEFGFDFHLGPTSPLKDAGVEPSGLGPDTRVAKDTDGEDAPVGAWDIGVDEVAAAP